MAREAGLEFVFCRGSALRYPQHTHTTSCTLTLVRRGLVCLHRGRSGKREAGQAICVYPRGSVYMVARHEPHSPAYSDDFDCASLCIDLQRCASVPRVRLNVLCAEYGGLLREKGLLRPEDLGALLDAVSALPAAEDLVSGHSPRAARHPAIRAALRQFTNCGKDVRALSAVALSPFQFIRRFKKDLGLTPHTYVLQRRLRAARRLLTDTPLTVAEVAASLGFCDQSHLDRCFKRALGISPSQYRRACVFWDHPL